MAMKRRCIATALFVFILVSFPVLAMAQTSIAVVDVQRLLTESEAAKSIQKQVQAKREKFLTVLSAQERELREMERELVEPKSDIPKERQAENKKAFEERFQQTRQMAQKARHDLDAATAKAMAQLRDAVYEVVGAIADERGYTLVLAKQNVVIGDKSIDISEESLNRLNKAVSDIKLEVEK
jgi:outer membrane protein